MKNLSAIILIILGLGLGYFGYNKLQDSRASIKIGDLKLSAGDTKETTTSYVLLGLGGICLLAGLISISKKQ